MLVYGSGLDAAMSGICVSCQGPAQPQGDPATAETQPGPPASLSSAGLPQIVSATGRLPWGHAVAGRCPPWGGCRVQARGGAEGSRRSRWSSWLASAPRRERLPWNLLRWKWDPGVSLWVGNDVRGFGIDEVQMCWLSFSSAALNRLRDINSAGTGWASLSLCL